MSHSTAVAAPIRIASARSRWRFSGTGALATAAFLFLWVEVIQQLRSEWTLNPEYAYGWTVPFLAGWIFADRWRNRPAPTESPFRGLTISLILSAAAILFPARIVAAANPDWRLLDWTFAVAAVVVSLGAIELVGGPSWRRHFAFPVVFFLVAVPWPVQLEQFVVQNLMRTDAAIAMQILNFTGTLAVQHGNVIELGSGQVGIDDACTGIRSLQATIMVALFLGEFYRLTKSRRVLLVLAGVLVAFICNIARTLFLCEIAANSGLGAISRWHDPAGYTVLFICLFVLWGMSLRLQAQTATTAQRFPNELQLRDFRWPLALILWLGLIETSAGFWYSRPAHSSSEISWAVAWPNDEPHFQNQPIPPAATELLRYNEGAAATWRSRDDHPWLLYSFHWLPGRTAALFVKNHRPDICLPAAGLTMQRDGGIHPATINGITLPIHSYRFNDQNHPLHIFYCYWDGRSTAIEGNASVSEDWSAGGRFRTAWEGKRERGARMIELAVWDYENDAEAEAALRQELASIIRKS